MRIIELSLFVPGWAIPWLVVLTIAAWIVGAKQFALGLTVLLIMDQVVAPLLEPYLATLPTWVLALVTATVILLVIHGLIVMIFGKEAAAHFTGTWLVRISDLLILGPFRMIRVLLRGLTGY